MRAIIIGIVFGLLSLSLWAAEAPQREAWEVKNTEGMAAYQQGKFEQAEASFTSALVEAEKFGALDMRVAMVVDNLAMLAERRKKFADAETLYQRSLTIWEQVLGADDPSVVAQLGKLGDVTLAQEKFAVAEGHYKRALELAAKALGPKHPEFDQVVGQLAACFLAQKKIADAEALYKTVLAKKEQAVGKEDAALAPTLTAMGDFYAGQKKFADAEPLFLRAQALIEKNAKAEYPAVMEGCLKVAGFYAGAEKFTESDKYYQRAVVILEKAQGKDSLELATILQDYAAMLTKAKRPEDAKALQARADAIFEAVFKQIEKDTPPEPEQKEEPANIQLPPDDEPAK